MKAPKSLHGNRTVFFPAGYEKALREWKCEQDILKAKQGERWREQNYIFTTNTSDMISVYTPTGLCAEFEKRHGLRHLKLHGLRHTCASLPVAEEPIPKPCGMYRDTTVYPQPIFICILMTGAKKKLPAVWKVF